MRLLKRRLTGWPNAFIKHEGTKYEIKSGGFARYFDLLYYNKGKKDEKFMYGRELRDVINEEIRLCGYFVIITSEKMTAAQALELYKSRDASEKLFRGDKSYLGNKRFCVHTSESVQAKIFIEFVAMIIRSRLYTCLKEQMQKSGKKNYMTVLAAIRGTGKDRTDPPERPGIPHGLCSCGHAERNPEGI